MKIEIKREHLVNHLSKGEVNFIFEKLDGTLRNSRGTTSSDIIGEVKEAKSKSTSIPYFDTDKYQWRSIAEGQKMYLETEWLRDIYSCPSLTDGEILFMLSEKEYLDKDSWYIKLVNLIKEAPQTELINFTEGYRDLLTSIWQWKNDNYYKEDIEKKWNKLESIITGTYN
jgi:hypothetical protein